MKAKIFLDGVTVGAVEDIRYDFPHHHGRWRPATGEDPAGRRARVAAFVASARAVAALDDADDEAAWSKAYDAHDEAFADLHDSEGWEVAYDVDGWRRRSIPCPSFADGEVDWRELMC